MFEGKQKRTQISTSVYHFMGDADASLSIIVIMITHFRQFRSLRGASVTLLQHQTETANLSSMLHPTINKINPNKNPVNQSLAVQVILGGKLLFFH